MQRQVVISNIVGTPNYTVYLCPQQPIPPVSATCTFILVDPGPTISFYVPDSLSALTQFTLWVVDSASCNFYQDIDFLSVNSCYPIFLSNEGVDLYYYNTDDNTANVYISGLTTPALLVGRSNNYIWTYDGSINIEEYDSTTNPPTFIRSIDCSTNSINPTGGISVWTADTELLVFDSTGDVLVIDITSTPAVVSETLFSVSPTFSPIPATNLIRDPYSGIIYIMVNDGVNDYIHGYYETGGFVASAQTQMAGTFFDGGQIKVIDFNGDIFNLTQTDDQFSLTSSGQNIVLFEQGFGQNPNCISSVQVMRFESISGLETIPPANAFRLAGSTSSPFSIDIGLGYQQVSPTNFDYIFSGYIGSSYVGFITFTGDTFSGVSNFSSVRSWPPKYVSGGTGVVETKELSKLFRLTGYTSSGIDNQLVLTGDVDDLPKTLLNLDTYNFSSSNLTGNTINFPPNIKTFTGVGIITGLVSNLPTSLTNITLDQARITGDTSELPPNLVTCILNPGDESLSIGLRLSGLTSNLPSTITNLTLGATNTITGDINNLPPNLTTLSVRGDNTLSGNVSDLPRTLTTILVTGDNTISGDTSGFPEVSTSVTITGLNTISGDLGSLPFTASSWDFVLGGDNTISGTSLQLFSGANIISIYQNTGQITGNTLSGDISGLSGSTTLNTFSVEGANTIFGDIGDLPTTTGLQNFVVYGNNTLTGDINDIPTGLLNFRVRGNNTIFGNLNTISAKSLRYLILQGNNTVGGTLDGTYSNIREFILASSGTLSGSFDNVTMPNCNGFYYSGASTVTGPVTNFAMNPSYLTYFIYTPSGVGLSSTDVDDLLVKFTGYTVSNGVLGGRTIDLRGANAAPTATGLAAKAILTAPPKNMSVFHN